MRPVVAFVFALLIASVQAGVLRFMGGGAAPVALALPIVVYLGLHAGNVEGAIGAAGVGYVLDLMAGSPKGLMTFLAVLLFLVSRLVGAAVSVQGKGGFAILSAVGTFFFGFGALLLMRAVAPPESTPSFRLLGRVLVEALITGALSPIIMVVMRRIDGLFVREETGTWLE